MRSLPDPSSPATACPQVFHAAHPGEEGRLRFLEYISHRGVRLEGQREAGLVELPLACACAVCAV